MKDLTVGKLEELLRPFEKGTSIHVGCRRCHSSSSGSEDIVGITDRSKETYGYIELELNEKFEPDYKVIISAEEKEFFIKEIEKLKETIKARDNELNQYKDLVNGLSNTIEGRVKWIERMSKNEN